MLQHKPDVQEERLGYLCRGQGVCVGGVALREITAKLGGTWVVQEEEALDW